MKRIKSIVTAVGEWCGLTSSVLMANALDHKTMLYKLLGLEDAADETMVNERYKSAMDAEDDGVAEKLAKDIQSANEAKVAAETLFANEKKIVASEKAAKEKAEADLQAANTAKTTAETNFANERKERAKLILDKKVVENKITGAQRKEYEVEFANMETFDATLAKLNAEKGTKLPVGRQEGMANIGSRRIGMSPDDSKRAEAVQLAANEEGKNPIYEGLTASVKYQRVMLAVQEKHPELYPASAE